jgi:hypothetical protein
MKRIFLYIFLLGFVSLSLPGCISKNEVELYPCDTTNMSYQKNIMPIIRQNCYKCHDSGNANLFAENNYLDSYDSLKFHVDFGLIYNIEHAPGVKAMPKGAPKLSDCEIAKIKAWANQGGLNN